VISVERSGRATNPNRAWIKMALAVRRLAFHLRVWLARSKPFSPPTRPKDPGGSFETRRTQTRCFSGESRGADSPETRAASAKGN
jgi:hypothetical protein